MPNPSVINATLTSGNFVYAGGTFATAGTTAASNIAVWDHLTQSWSAMGAGITPKAGMVNAIVKFGTDIYAGGEFTSAGGVTVSNIAKWNGTAWSAVGTGVTGGVIKCMIATATDIYVGGTFTSAGSVANTSYLAKYNPTDGWRSVTSAAFAGTAITINVLEMVGSDLYVGGVFTSVGAVTGTVDLAKFNGTTWSAIGSGVSGGQGTAVYAINYFKNKLFVGGKFTTPYTNVARWNGTSWEALGTGTNQEVKCFADFGRVVYVGGGFSSAGGVASTAYCAKWNEELGVWEALAQGTNGNVFTLSVQDLVGRLIVGGNFSGLPGYTAVSANSIASIEDGYNPLPVELVEFSGRFRNEAAILNWQTRTEVQNTGFGIERRDNTGRDWDRIGFVEGHFISNSPQYYEFTDRSILPGRKYFYRLRQIDADGSSHLSPVIEVDAGNPQAFELLQNYPNPFSNGSVRGGTATTISFKLPEDSDVTLKIYDITGKEIATPMSGRLSAGYHSIPFDGSSLAAGVYFYTLRAGKFVTTRKMAVIH